VRCDLARGDACDDDPARPEHTEVDEVLRRVVIAPQRKQNDASRPELRVQPAVGPVADEYDA
jgi:hypothetical protein